MERDDLCGRAPLGSGHSAYDRSGQPADDKNAGVTHLLDLQREIQELRHERGFTTDPARIVILLLEELGEVAREVKGTWSPNYPPVDSQKLAAELADVFVLITALASAFDIDVEVATRNKFFEGDEAREWQSRNPS